MDRLQAVRLFIRVVDLGSFSKAASEAHIGQPAATKQIAQMEKQLGARLLHRTTHGVTPTEIGALYYEKCRLIAHHSEEAQSLASLLQSQVKGSLRVSTSVAFGRRVVVPLMMRFMEQNPSLQVDLSFDDRYVNLVEQGIDVAIRMGALADSTLGSRYLGMNPWVLVASPAYLQTHGTPKTPAALAEHEALIYSSVQVFDRNLEISRGSADIVGPEDRILIVEGNYLLLDEAPWNTAQYDLTAFIDVPEAELDRRLLARWAHFGKTPEQARAWIDGNDMPNIRRVNAGSRAADVVLRQD